MTAQPQGGGSGLARFQSAFLQALYAVDAHAALADEARALAAQPAFAVYRNTVTKGCIDALAANFPAVLRLVGEEWFRGAAAVFMRSRRPSDPRLVLYGEGFPEFLAAFEPAAELPYLAGVARLDRYWTEAHTAPNAEPLAPDALRALAPAVLAATPLRPLPSARWAWFDEGPIYDIWTRNREAEPGEAELEWRAQGALVLRPHDRVRWLELDAGACAFLDACADGQSLAAAAQAAIARSPSCSIATLVSELLAAGAFAGIDEENGL